MHGANLYLSCAKPKVECMSSGVSILPQKVQVKPRHSDPLRISWRTKSGQGPLHVSKDVLCLVFRCFCERRKRSGLALHGSRADFIEDAVDSHRVEEVGISRLLNHRQEFTLRHRPRYIQLLLRLEKSNHSERRLLLARDGASGPIRSKLIKRPIKTDHLAIELVERSKPEVAMFSDLAVCRLALVNPGD